MHEIILDVLLDSLLDTFKLLPFLLIIYIIIELIEQKSSIAGVSGRLKGKFGVLIGAATGLIPQCGFSVMAAKLYDGGYIAVGTLLAIFISTSDEAFILLLASGEGAAALLPMILVKIVVAVSVGYFVNWLAAHFARQKFVEKATDKADYHSRIFQKKEQAADEYCSCGRTHDEAHPAVTYFIDPLLHSLKISAYLFLVTAAFGFIFEFFEDEFTALMNSGLYLQPLITSLIGLIPNCASSVVVTQSYLLGQISFGACVAGLCTNAGLGFVVLLKNTKEWKRNALLIGGIYLTGVVTGIIVIFLQTLFKIV